MKDLFTKKVLLEGNLEGGLYKLCSSNSSTPIHYSSLFAAGFSASINANIWHFRLGHPSLSIVKQVLESCKLDLKSNIMSTIYSSCQEAKIHRLSFFFFNHSRAFAPIWICSF